MARHETIVQELKDLLTKNKGWGQLLVDSLVEAKKAARKVNLKGADSFPETLDGYYKYLAAFVRWIPGAHLPTDRKKDWSFDKDAFYELCRFYWLLDQPPGRKLQENEKFQQWMVDFAKDWGSFCDTPESITNESLEAFSADSRFNIEQYMHKTQEKPDGWSIPVDQTSADPNAPKQWWVPNNPSGWLTFNQFFARQVSPGMRPVAGMFDDKIVTSPADSTFYQKFDISESSDITLKYTHRYSVLELLEASPYRDRFRGGLFMHSFLSPYDYHRFRAPVRGTVLESRAIQGNVILDVQIKEVFTGGKKVSEFDAPDGAGYQFTQERGLIIFDSPVGLVAVLPIGMAQVSSVNMTAVEGSYLNKGEEFGYFMFGGSDIIMLFEADSDVVITAAPNIHYNCGMCVGEVIENG